MRLSGGSDPLAYIGQSITQRLDFRVTSIHLWSQPVAKRPTEHGFLFGGIVFNKNNSGYDKMIQACSFGGTSI